MLLTAAWIALALATVPVAFFALRLLVFGLAALLLPRRVPPAGGGQTRFLVLIPAHNEERHIALAVESAQSQRYLSENVRPVVLADNCTDNTARIARGLGAKVMERSDPDRPGKQHAIRWFLAETPADGYDALVILDADTRMQPDYLAALDKRLAAGAPAAQGFNGVLNPDDSMFTRLTYITNTMKNRLYYAGKAMLGLSVPLMNGMAVRADVLAEDGFGAESVAEDFETYLRLAARGAKVAFAPEQRVLSLKASGFDEAYEQRVRWSAGQSQVTRSLVPRLFARAIRERSVLLADAALDLAAPGYATLTGACAVLLAGAVLLPATALGAVVTPALALCLLSLFANFTAGLLVAGPTPLRIASVFLAPVFIAWKAVIAARGLIGKGPGRWVRGAR